MVFILCMHRLWTYCCYLSSVWWEKICRSWSAMLISEIEWKILEMNKINKVQNCGTIKKNFVSIPNTMEPKKIWNIDLLWKILWYYTETNGIFQTTVTTRVIQKIRRQRCCQAQKVLKKSNLTHGKIQNHIFYQQLIFRLIWLSSLDYIWF